MMRNYVNKSINILTLVTALYVAFSLYSCSRTHNQESIKHPMVGTIIKPSIHLVLLERKSRTKTNIDNGRINKVAVNIHKFIDKEYYLSQYDFVKVIKPNTKIHINKVSYKKSNGIHIKSSPYHTIAFAESEDGDNFELDVSYHAVNDRWTSYSIDETYCESNAQCVLINKALKDCSTNEGFNDVCFFSVKVEIMNKQSKPIYHHKDKTVSIANSFARLNEYIELNDVKAVTDFKTMTATLALPPLEFAQFVLNMNAARRQNTLNVQGLEALNVSHKNLLLEQM